MLKPMEIRRFRKWLRDMAINAEEREFVNSLTEAELQAVARFLVNNGVVLDNGVPRDVRRAERYLDEAYIEVNATRLGQIFRG
jgi:uncharacterized protein (UPF0147 family)